MKNVSSKKRTPRKQRSKPHLIENELKNKKKSNVSNKKKRRPKRSLSRNGKKTKRLQTQRRRCEKLWPNRLLASKQHKL